MTSAHHLMKVVSGVPNPRPPWYFDVRQQGDALADTDRWILRFTEDDLADFEQALARVSGQHFGDVTEIQAQDFPLPHFRERIDDIADRLEHGLGLVLLRGLPVYDRFSEDEASIIYWGIGRHLGNLVPQNRKGDLIGAFGAGHRNDLMDEAQLLDGFRR